MATAQIRQSRPMRTFRRMRSRDSTSSLLVLLLCALSSPAVDSAVPIWQYVIQGGGTLGGPRVGRGNGVVATHEGGDVWVTTHDGSVRILQQPQSGAGVSEIRYDPVLPPDRSTESQSSISLSQSQSGGVQFGVYAVIDRPTTEGGNITSRVIAVYPSGAKRWEVTLEGIAVGTPQVGGDGEMVFITHNTWSETFQGYMRGRLSVFRNDFHGMGGEVPMNGAGALGFAEKDAPFGSVSVVTRSDGSDRVYWGEAWSEGRGSFGLLYRFDAATFHITGLSRTSWSTVAPPTLSVDESSMWIGGQGSCLHGWPADHAFALKPLWSVAVDPNSTDASAPITTRAVVSADSSRVCSSSAGNSVFCLNATNGDLLWIDTGEAPTYASSHMTLDGNYLYSMSKTKGLLRKYHTASGMVLSDFSCEDITGSKACQLHVEAEFTLSGDGKFLFYSDVYGRVVALRFDDATFSPTATPSLSPTAPTMLPSATPTVDDSATPSSYPSTQPTSTPSSLPTIVASGLPSLALSVEPSGRPTNIPSALPSPSPTMASSSEPTNFNLVLLPTETPSPGPSPGPSQDPSGEPSGVFSIGPTAPPTDLSVVLDYFGVDFDEILAQAQEKDLESLNRSGDSGMSLLLLFSVVIVVLVVVTLGILVGRIWQVRRAQALTLPTTNEESSQENVSVGRPVHRFSSIKMCHSQDEEIL